MCRPSKVHARRIAKELIKGEMRAQGMKLSMVNPSALTKAVEFLLNQPEGKLIETEAERQFQFYLNFPQFKLPRSHQ